MEAFLGWCCFESPGACKIPNAGIVPAGVDWWQVRGCVRLRIVCSYNAAACFVRASWRKRNYKLREEFLCLYRDAHF